MFSGVPSSDQKDSLIDLDEQATGSNVDVLSSKFTALCE